MKNHPLQLDRPTDAEREEARYEAWLLTGGPAKVTAQHKAPAYQYLAVHMNDWQTLTHELVREGDIHVLEAVVRRDNQVRLIKWNAFNKGFMTTHNSCGWVIFDPAHR